MKTVAVCSLLCLIAVPPSLASSGTSVPERASVALPAPQVLGDPTGVAALFRSSGPAVPSRAVESLRTRDTVRSSYSTTSFRRTQIADDLGLAEVIPPSLSNDGVSEEALSSNQRDVHPLAAASADINEDGIADLIAAYSTPAGGLLAVFCGTGTTLWSTNPDHDARATSGPFSPASTVIPLSFAPEMVAAVDADADGHVDLVTGRPGNSAIDWFKGTGTSVFSRQEPVYLEGTATAFGVGEVGRPDGLDDIVVSVSSSNGASLSVYRSKGGAFGGAPERLELPGPATAIATGEFDGRFGRDILVFSTSRMLLAYEGCEGCTSRSLVAEVVPLPAFAVQATREIRRTVAGDFDGDGRDDVAVLSAASGAVSVIASRHATGKRDLVLGGWPFEYRQMKLGVHVDTIAAVSLRGSTSTDLLATAANGRQVLLVDSAAGVDCEQPLFRSLEPARDRVSALIPMRLTPDGRDDIVMLTDGSLSPTLSYSVATSTFTVSSTNDSGPGTLRQSIINANSTPGSDQIVFDISGPGPHTISISSALPALSEACLLDGSSQPGYTGPPVIVVDGINSPDAVAGIRVTGSSCVVRSLAVVRHRAQGIALIGSSNVVEGCYVGISTDGQTASGNRFSGVSVQSGTNNRVGGTSAFARNVLSGNLSCGLDLGGTATLIQGNYIGTNAAGTATVGTQVHGIQPHGPNGGNHAIGGTTAGAGNVISGNQAIGVVGSGFFSGLLVQQNFIGVSALGTGIVPNGSDGVQMSDDLNVTIGGSTPTARNVISGNQHGILCTGSFLQNLVVENNYIGTDASGVTGLGNRSDGVLLNAPGATTHTVEGNRIVASSGAGIRLVGAGTAHMTRNELRANANLGIDFGPAGVTPNDADDSDAGVNGLQNFPVLTTARVVSGNVHVSGSLQTTPNKTFEVEVFASGSCDASGYGEAEAYVGSGNVTTDGAGAAAISLMLPAGLQAGQVITATASDPLDNTSELSACVPVTICDLACPANISVNTAPSASSCGASVAYAVPQLPETCGTVACVPASGSVFPVGVTIVNCSSSSGSECMFSVTVVDATAPVIQCPAPVFVDAPSTGCSAVVNFATPSASDNCAGATVACVPASGSTFPIGVTMVTCTATDAASNTGSCSFNVTVNDTEAPAVMCPGPISVGNAPGQCSAVVTYSASASDNCPGFSVSCVPASGSTFSVGVTTVSCTATDAASNTGVCSFSVTVNDTQTPALSCPANIQTTALTSSGRVVSYTVPMATDNCGATVSCLPASGSTFAIGTTTVTCTATDAANNSTNCQFTVDVAPLGTDTAGIYVPATGAWFLRNDNSPGVADLVFGYGPAGLGWLPLKGDWDGNGTDTAGLYDPVSGFFFLKNSNAPGAADLVYGFGPAGQGWMPLVGDWDGDGADTVGLYNPANGFFFLRNVHAPGAADLVYGFGPAGLGWMPLVGDWDGDGADTVGLYNPANGFFFLRNVHAPGAADLVYGFGPAGIGWKPLAGDWNGDGADTIGLYSPTNGFFFLRNVHAPGAADVVFGYGPANTTPILGDWNGL